MTKDITIHNNGFMDVINKVSEVPSAETVDTLERMMRLQLEWEDKQDRKVFNEAMTRVAAKLSGVRIVKRRKVAYKNEGGYTYANIEDIGKIVDPILAEEELRLEYDTEVQADNRVLVTAEVIHANGQSKKSHFTVSIDKSGGKNDIQGMGSAFSYGRRFALCGLLNIITVDEDDDANGLQITIEHAKEIKQGLQETGIDVGTFLKSMKAESVDDMRDKHYRKAMILINARRHELHMEKEAKNGKVS